MVIADVTGRDFATGKHTDLSFPNDSVRRDYEEFLKKMRACVGAVNKNPVIEIMDRVSGEVDTTKRTQ